MDKKTYLLKLLDSLSGVWSLAKGLRTIVEEKNFNDEVLDMIIKSIKSAISSTKNVIIKSKLEKGSNFLKILKESESKQDYLDSLDIENLEKLLG